MLGSTVSYLMIVCGSISCFGTGFVIIFYWTHTTLQRSIYNKVIYYMSICDFFTSLGGSFGYVREGTPLCDLQAILTNIFPLSSVFWVTILIYIYLKLLTSHESIHIIHYTIHSFCWGFPILLTFLPLTTNKFGIIDGDIGWCWLDDRSNTPSWTGFFWNVISFYLWIWLAIGVYLLFYFYILYEIKTRYDTFSSSENILRTLHKISLYPLSVVCCWCLPCIYDQLDYYQPNHSTTTDNLLFGELSSITPLLQGTFTCLIFISTNSEIIFLSFNQMNLKYLTCLWKPFFSTSSDHINASHEEGEETSARISSSRMSSVRLHYPSNSQSPNQTQSHHPPPPPPSHPPSHHHQQHHSGEVFRAEMTTSPLAYRSQS